MKKSMIIPLLLLFLFTSNFAICPYNIPVNQTYSYDVKKAEVYVKLNDNSNSGKGFKINDAEFNQRSIIQASVDSLGGDNVLWTLTSEEETLVKLADWNLVDEASLSSNILNPFSIIQDFLLYPITSSEGLGLIFYPFLGTNRTIEFFNDLKNQTHYQYIFFMPKVEDAQFEAYVEEFEQLFLFETLVIGRLNQNLTTPKFNISFVHHCQLVYDISIGLLYGSRFFSKGSGIFENKTAEYSFESHIELRDYNLPKPEFITDAYPIRWIIIGVSGCLILIVMPIVIIRFRKKKL